MDYDIEKVKLFHTKWLENVSEKDQETIKKLLMRIFPKFESVFNNISYGSEWEATWRKKLRICSVENFEVYFRLAVPKGQISNMEMQSILALAASKDVFAKKLVELSKQHRLDGSTRVSAFLERMEDYTKKDIPNNHIPQILKALFDVGDELLVSEDEGWGLFSWGNDIRIGRIMFQLLKRYETQEEQFEILKDAFSQGHAVSMIVCEVSSLGQQHGKYGAKTKPDEVRLVDKQHINELGKIALNKIKQAVKKNSLLTVPHLSHIIYRWRDWEGIKPVKDWISTTISTDEGLVHLLKGFLSKSYRQAMDDRVAKQEWSLDPNELDKFLDTQKIIERCQNIVKEPPNWLRDELKIAVQTFIKGYNLRLEGKDTSDPIAWRRMSRG